MFNVSLLLLFLIQFPWTLSRLQVNMHTTWVQPMRAGMLRHTCF